MAGVEYDADAMRTALTKLREMQVEQQHQDQHVETLVQAQPPGTAPATDPFHQKFSQWAHSMREQHDAAVSETRQAIEALVAIDRQYNNGEVANAMGMENIGRDRV